MIYPATKHELGLCTLNLKLFIIDHGVKKKSKLQNSIIPYGDFWKTNREGMFVCIYKKVSEDKWQEGTEGLSLSHGSICTIITYYLYNFKKVFF